MRRNLENLWNEWEGRLFLINIANQLQAGVIDKESIEPFFKKAKKDSVDFSTRRAALGDEADVSGFRLNKLHLRAKVGPEPSSGYLLLRVAPMNDILGAVELTGDNPGIRRSRAISQLNEIRRIQSYGAAQELAENHEKLFRHHLFDTKNPSEWDIPDCFKERELVPGRLIDQGINFSDDYGVPVSFSPCFRGSALQGEFKSSKDVTADSMRNKLGLDHYASTFQNERVVLGFFLVRYEQIRQGKILRPTPFDDTSAGRFRACYGKFREKRGELGRTANLANIGSTPELEGISEVVCPNHVLKTAQEDVLIGYLGPVMDHRNDAYKEGRIATMNDDFFLSICAGDWDKDQVINKIVETAQ